MQRMAAVGLAAALVVAVVSCGEDKVTGPTPTPTVTPTLVGLVLLGAPSASIAVGQSVYLRVAQKFSDNSLVPIISGAIWTSSAPGAVSVTPGGVATAIASGQATIGVSYLGGSASSLIRVVEPFADDLDFRVVILNATSSHKPDGDVLRIFALANTLLTERTSSHMRLLDMQDVAIDTAANVARAYLDARTGDQPDGIIIWSQEATAISAGGFSTTLARPAPYVNRYTGSNRVFLSSIHYEHKYGRCGYDTTGEIRISDRSANGECRNQSGLVCVDNGKFWECPDVRNNFYAQPDVFTATTIVHEFMHPVGTAGNNDHYGTETCRTRTGMSQATANDLAQAQWHCGQCPDLFLNFRPRGAPATNGRGASGQW